MALNVKQGFVSLYLTKPQKWGEEGDWVEYPFSIKERSFTHIIEYDEETAYNITTAVETAVPILKSCIELLGGAEIVDDEYYFRNQYLGARFVELKDLTWSNYDSCLRHNDKFYIKKM
jgi:hypothetical protein